MKKEILGDLGNFGLIKKQVHQYMQEEEAVEDIQMIVLYTLGFSMAVAVGWWVWGKLKNQAESESCDNTDSPFCVS